MTLKRIGEIAIVQAAKDASTRLRVACYDTGGSVQKILNAILRGYYFQRSNVLSLYEYPSVKIMRGRTIFRTLDHRATEFVTIEVLKPS